MSERRIALNLFGHEHDVTNLASKSCACERQAECPQLRLIDLEHVCWNTEDAFGNAHKDKRTGEWWVEWHFNWCWSLDNHFHDGSWLVTRGSDGRPLTPDDYTDYLDRLTVQGLAGSTARSAAQEGHASVQMRASEIRLIKAETFGWAAKEYGVSESEAKEKLTQLFGYILASRIVARTQIALNHEAADKYEAAEMLRLWPGEVERLTSISNTQPALRLIRDGKLIELETASLPAARKLKGGPDVDWDKQITIRRMLNGTDEEVPGRVRDSKIDGSARKARKLIR